MDRRLERRRDKQASGARPKFAFRRLEGSRDRRGSSYRDYRGRAVQTIDMDARVLERVVKKERERLEREKGWKGPATRPTHRYGATLMGITFSSSIVVALFSFFPKPDSSHPVSTQLCSLLFPPPLAPFSFLRSSAFERVTRDETKRNETKVNTYVYKCTGIL